MDESRDDAGRFTALPRAARAYLISLAAAAIGTLVLVSSIGAGPETDLTLLVLLAALCAAGATFEIFAPGHYALQPSFAFFFWGALLLPGWGIAVLALASFVPDLVMRRTAAYKIVFNVSNYTLSGIVAAAVMAATGGAGAVVGGEWLAIAGMMGAAVVCTTTNHVLLLIVASLATASRPKRMVHQLVEGLPLSTGVALMGSCLAALWVVDEALVVLAAGPVALVSRSLWVPMLRHRAQTDPKTGLLNFDAFKDVFADELDTARRSGDELCVVMMDLDHLRAINNRCGHLTGDRVIRGIAATLLELTPDSGYSARFGGEEFCILLPGYSVAQSQALMADLRERVLATGFREGSSDPELRVTFSAGIARFPEHGETLTALMAAADEAVYDAKAAGRDRVRVALSASARDALGLPDAAPARDALGLTPAPPAPAAAHPDTAPPPRSARADAPVAAAAHARLREIAGAAGSAAVDEDDIAYGVTRRRVARYASAVAAAATAIGIVSGFSPLVDAPEMFAVLVGAVIVLDAVRIDMFGRGHVSPGAVPSIALAWGFGPIGPLAAELVVAALRLARRDPLARVAVDFGHLSLAGAVAAGVFAAFQPTTDLAMVAVAGVAGLSYYAANAAGLVAVWWVAERASPRASFRERFAWALPQYLFFGLLAGLFTISEQRMGIAAAALLLCLPVLALWLAQKQYLDRSRSGVAELRHSHAELERSNRRLHALLTDNQELLKRMQGSYLTTITSLARTIEAKDPYTGGHTERVGRIAVRLASELGYSGGDLRAIEMGSVIHDIGKIGVQDAVLLKEGSLDRVEEDEMRRHPEMGSYILADLELPVIVKQMVRSHHERFDGAGYPDGIAGEEIPLPARILAVADALDAMLSDRPYRSALTVEAAYEQIAVNSGTQFCPNVVAALEACVEQDKAFWKALAQQPAVSATPAQTT